MSGIGLFSAMFFAHRNLRLGKGDRTGSKRIVGAALLLAAGENAALLHVIPTFETIIYIFERLSVSLLFAAVIWLLFISLEPAVRARWPHTLITWNRLTTGQWRDPGVASHILIGLAFGVAYLLLFILHIYWNANSRPEGPAPFLLGGVRPLVAKICIRASNALLWGSAIFFLLCGVRVLARNNWLAIGISSILLTFFEGSVRHSSNLALDIPIFLVLYVGFALVLIRVGLLPAIVASFTLNTLGDSPLSSDFGAWFNWITTVHITLILSLAIYAFKRSQAEAATPEAIGGAFGHTPRPVTAR